MANVIIEFIIWVVMLPVSLVLATPIILVTSIFKKDGYIKNVKRGYIKIIKWWKRICF